MENTTPNNPVDALPPTQKAAAPQSPVTESSTNQPRKKKMSEAALAANRANAQKSTGPRTASGKARSASNAFQHGLYSMKNYRHLVMVFLRGVSTGISAAIFTGISTVDGSLAIDCLLVGSLFRLLFMRFLLSRN